MTSPVNMINAFTEQEDPIPVDAGDAYPGVISSAGVKETSKGKPYVEVKILHDPMGDHPSKSHNVRLWLTPKAVRFFRRTFRDFGGDPDALPEKGSGVSVSPAELDNLVNETFTNEECLFDLTIEEPDEWHDTAWNDVRNLRPAH